MIAGVRGWGVPKKQFCRTVIIYCGSGSFFDKVLVPVLAPVPVMAPVPVQVLDPDLFRQSFFNKKSVQNLAFSMLQLKQHNFPES